MPGPSLRENLCISVIKCFISLYLLLKLVVIDLYPSAAVLHALVDLIKDKSSVSSSLGLNDKLGAGTQAVCEVVAALLPLAGVGNRSILAPLSVLVPINVISLGAAAYIELSTVGAECLDLAIPGGCKIGGSNIEGRGCTVIVSPLGNAEVLRLDIECLGSGVALYLVGGAEHGHYTVYLVYTLIAECSAAVHCPGAAPLAVLIVILLTSSDVQRYIHSGDPIAEEAAISRHLKLGERAAEVKALQNMYLE